MGRISYCDMEIGWLVCLAMEARYCNNLLSLKSVTVLDTQLQFSLVNELS